VKLGIKEKRQEKGEDNKKTCRTRNERKQGRIYAHGRGLQRESRVGPSRSSFEEAKEKEKTEKEKSGDRNKTVYFYFFGIAVLYSEKM
jgi:hypothetical protein